MIAEAPRHAQVDVALRYAAVAGFVGTFVEWFDYACYGYLAALFAVVFFPAADSRTGLIAAYGVFALSFIVRPIGAVVWGHVGDRLGRKQALSASIFIMSAATAVIAVLPTYEMAGFWAPAALLATRLLQGFAASGEYAGAASFLAEHAPAKRRGFYTCLVPAGEAAGLLAASLTVALLHFLLSAEQLRDWGWRLAFLLAVPFGFSGVFIRRRLEESPQFLALEESQRLLSAPLFDLFAAHRRELLIGFGATMLNAVGFYLVLSYMPIYLTSELGANEGLVFIGSSLSLAIYLSSIFVMGALSDRFGRRKILVVCSLLFMFATLPLFILLADLSIGSSSPTGFLAMLAIWSMFAVLLAMNGGTLPTFLCELFPTRVRFSGFALSFNTANALFGGTAPLISTWLIGTTGSKLAPAWYLVAAALVTLAAISCGSAAQGCYPSHR